MSWQNIVIYWVCPICLIQCHLRIKLKAFFFFAKYWHTVAKLEFLSAIQTYSTIKALHPHPHNPHSNTQMSSDVLSPFSHSMSFRFSYRKRGASQSITQKLLEELWLSARGFSFPLSLRRAVSLRHCWWPAENQHLSVLNELFLLTYYKQIIWTYKLWLCNFPASFFQHHTVYILPEVMDNISWQDVYEENGQADVEQDYHADHYGIWALEKKGTYMWYEDSEWLDFTPCLYLCRITCGLWKWLLTEKVLFCWCELDEEVVTLLHVKLPAC